jgi:N-methylhydantoinase A
VTATVPGTDVTLVQPDEDQQVQRSRRQATLAGQQLELEVIRGAPSPGTGVAGPAVVELPESTLLVPPDWSGEVDAGGTIRLTRSSAAASRHASR